MENEKAYLSTRRGRTDRSNQPHGCSKKLLQQKTLLTIVYQHPHIENETRYDKTMDDRLKATGKVVNQSHKKGVISHVR